MIEVNFTVFSGLLIKSQVFKAIGVPVGDFFMMCDDLEFCMRAVKNGFKIGIIDLDMHEALHLGSVSSSTSTIWRSYYQSRNRILILKRQMSLYNFLDCIIWETKFLYSSLINNSPLKRIRYRLLGIFDGIIGRKGFTVDPKKF